MDIISIDRIDDQTLEVKYENGTTKQFPVI